MAGMLGSPNPPHPKPPKPLFDWTDSTNLASWMRDRQRGFEATLGRGPNSGQPESQQMPQWLEAAKARPRPASSGRLRDAAARSLEQDQVVVQLSRAEVQRLNSVLHSALELVMSSPPNAWNNSLGKHLLAWSRWLEKASQRGRSIG
jgi:hypothetical protein